MTEQPPPGHHRPVAYKNERFLDSPDARALRILSEFLEPFSHFRRERIRDTVVFFGSARIEEKDSLGRYYREARTLARMVTEWSDQLRDPNRRFVVCTGGGPGIMEAGNRGAQDANGKTVGLNIGLPFEQYPNPYITPELSFQFHYFFMRKFWFAYFAKAMIVMPGGFGTIDELMEILTLMQTLKIKKHLPIVLFGTEFWDQVLDLDAMVEYGTIDRDDLALVFRTDSVDEAFDFITSELTEHALAEPGGALGPVTEPDGASR